MYHSVSVRIAGGRPAAGRPGGGPPPLRRRRRSLAALDALRPHHDLHGPDRPAAPAGRGAGGPARFDSLRLLVHAGAPCPPALKRAALDRVRPGVLWEFYGSTEGQFTVCSPDEWLAAAGHGGAGPARAPARGGRGRAPCGATRRRSPASRYWRDPAATARAWRGDAFTVGDLGRLDDDGYLFLDGRRDDLVISGGVNVYPAEVEAVLAERRPAWPRWRCSGWTTTTGGSGCARRWSGEVDEADAARRHAERAPGPLQAAQGVLLVAELPHTATGKVRRRDLPGLLGLAPPPAPSPRLGRRDASADAAGGDRSLLAAGWRGG